MARGSAAGQSRARGSIEPLSSGALRVSVYAGIDPVTGRRHYLKEIVKAGPKARREAEAACNRLLGAGMPERPVELDEVDQIKAEPRFRYQAVAATVARQVADGTLAPGLPAPPAAALASEHGVSLATAKRSLVLLTEWGTLARHGCNEIQVVGPTIVPQAQPTPVAAPAADDGAGTLLVLTVRRRGTEVAQFSTVADPASASELHDVLAAAVARTGGAAGEITDYEMDVRLPTEPAPMLTFVASSRTA